MFIGVCPGCGLWRTGRTIVTENGISYAVCKGCGHKHPFKRLPLYVVLGPSCTGKTTLALEIPRHTTEVIALDGDFLLDLNKDGDWDAYRARLLEIAANIDQCGKSVLLLMGGMPQDYYNNEAAIYFSSIECASLYAPPEELEKRLRARPDWRQSSQEPFIQAMLHYNEACAKLPRALNTAEGDVAQTALALLQRFGIQAE